MPAGMSQPLTTCHDVSGRLGCVTIRIFLRSRKLLSLSLGRRVGLGPEAIYHPQPEVITYVPWQRLRGSELCRLLPLLLSNSATAPSAIPWRGEAFGLAFKSIPSPVPVLDLALLSLPHSAHHCRGVREDPANLFFQTSRMPRPPFSRSPRDRSGIAIACTEPLAGTLTSSSGAGARRDVTLDLRGGAEQADSGFAGMMVSQPQPGR